MFSIKSIDFNNKDYIIIVLLNANLHNRYNGIAEQGRVYEKKEDGFFRTNVNYEELFDLKYNNLVIDSTRNFNKDSIINYIYEDYVSSVLMRDKIFFDISDRDTIFVNSPFVDIDTIINLEFETDYIIRNDSIKFDNECPISEYTNTYKKLINKSDAVGSYRSNYIIKVYSDSLQHNELLNKHGNLNEEHFIKYFYVVSERYCGSVDCQYYIRLSPYRNHGYINYYMFYH